MLVECIYGRKNLSKKVKLRCIYFVNCKGIKQKPQTHARKVQKVKHKRSKAKHHETVEVVLSVMKERSQIKQI